MSIPISRYTIWLVGGDVYKSDRVDVGPEWIKVFGVHGQYSLDYYPRERVLRILERTDQDPTDGGEE